jgi:hypothetical protein
MWRPGGGAHSQGNRLRDCTGLAMIAGGAHSDRSIPVLAYANRVHVGARPSPAASTSRKPSPANKLLKLSFDGLNA